MCGYLTNYLCTGCKRPLCMTKGKDIDSKFESFVKKYKIPPHLCPSKEVILSEYDTKKEQRVEKRAYNLCYHLAHSAQWEGFFKMADSNGTDGANMAALYEKYLPEQHDKNKENNSNSE